MSQITSYSFLRIRTGNGRARFASGALLTAKPLKAVTVNIADSKSSSREASDSMQVMTSYPTPRTFKQFNNKTYSSYFSKTCTIPEL